MKKYSATVGELIEFLTKINPDAEVVLYSSNDETVLPIISEETYEYDPYRNELSIFGHIQAPC